ncbi:hypothetical protein [Labrenzia sp. OB1]|uniref:hypothetical protein n=1 Tax=Labrenzia sp. OB1 TaxID=1561204 RepID=UPI0007B20C81|nr:hypothetical protein [Labrenzia sp. OB1]KZM46961.1 hypothetical protein OA90_26590 [Labrenzia sp. OB1]
MNDQEMQFLPKCERLAAKMIDQLDLVTMVLDTSERREVFQGALIVCARTAIKRALKTDPLLAQRLAASFNEGIDLALRETD